MIILFYQREALLLSETAQLKQVENCFSKFLVLRDTSSICVEY